MCALMVNIACVLMAVWSQLRVSVRVGGSRRLFCIRHWRVEVGTHAATRSQTLARCHHCFLHRARERRREGKQAWWSQQLSGARIFFYSLWNWGQEGLLFRVWGLYWEKMSRVWRRREIVGNFGKKWVPKTAATATFYFLWPIIVILTYKVDSAQCVNNKLTFF